MSYDFPWLKDTIQYDPYDEIDYPQPQESEVQRPKFCLRDNYNSIGTEHRLSINPFEFIQLRKNLGFSSISLFYL